MPKVTKDELRAMKAVDVRRLAKSLGLRVHPPGEPKKLRSKEQLIASLTGKNKAAQALSSMSRQKMKRVINVNWAEKLGITAPGAELSKDLGPLISRNLKPPLEIAPPGNDLEDRVPWLDFEWENAVKKGLRIVKQTNKYIEVRIPPELRSFIPNIPSRVRMISYSEPQMISQAVMWPLKTPAGYVRKLTYFWLHGYKPKLVHNQMTNLWTLSQNRSGNLRDTGGNRGTNRGKEIRTDQPRHISPSTALENGYLNIEVTNNFFFIENKYFQSGRGVQVMLEVENGEMSGHVKILSKKQLRPEPRAPSKRRRTV